MKTAKRLSEMEGILKISKGKSRKIIDEIRKEWDKEL